MRLSLERTILISLKLKRSPNWRKLAKAYTHFVKLYGSVYVETDMRAMHNPYESHKSAAIKLATKINSLCPDCKTPGFGITDAKQGLLAELPLTYSFYFELHL
jgi:hypothetical protein